MNKLDAARDAVRTSINETAKMEDSYQRLCDSVRESTSELREFRGRLFSEHSAQQRDLHEKWQRVEKVLTKINAREFWLKWIVIVAALLLLSTLLLECMILLAFMKR
ncbi:MAG: hypothetical protein JWN76_2844 [Chitinophagaceae bacterium]|nr:hypothetical protein [Chitinophagaceae bacterium]